MASNTDLAFGYKRRVIVAPALWGARAIYGDGEVDLLYDRQDMKADDDVLKEKLKRKLNGRALAAFRSWAGDWRFDQKSEDVETLVVHGVHFTASTNASYGYLYVTAALS